MNVVHAEAPVLTAPSGSSNGQSTQAGTHVEQDPEDRQAWFRSMWEGNPSDAPAEREETVNEVDDAENAEEDDDFGDDFDDFAEGGGDDDFGDFDEAEETPAAAAPQETQPTPSTASILAGLVSSTEQVSKAILLLHSGMIS